MRVRLFEQHEGSEVQVRSNKQKPSEIRTVTPQAHCPSCGRVGGRRRGVGFDHELRCGDCNLSWEPGRSYTLVKFLDQ